MSAAEAAAPFIGQNKVGGDQTIVVENAVRIDECFVTQVAITRGFLAPDQAVLLQAERDRALRDLDALRALGPDWARGVDAILAGGSAAAPAFDRLEREVTAENAGPWERVAEAKLLHARAVMLDWNDGDKAVRLLERVVAMAPHDWDYAHDLAKARLMAGQVDAVLDQLTPLRDMAERHPEPEEAMAELDLLEGLANQTCGRTDRAIAAFRRAAGHMEQTAADAANQAEHVGAWAFVLGLIAESEVKAGRLEAAQAAYQRAAHVAVDALGPGPEWVPVLTLGLYLREAEADVAQRANKLPEARSILGNCIAVWLDLSAKAAPGSAIAGGAARQVGRLLAREADCAEAAGDLDVALTSHRAAATTMRDAQRSMPMNMIVAMGLADAILAQSHFLHRRGKRDQAKQGFEAGLALARDLARTAPPEMGAPLHLGRAVYGVAKLDPMASGELWAEVRATLGASTGNLQFGPEDQEKLDASERALTAIGTLRELS